MRGIIMNDCKELRKAIKKKCASEDLENINKCIENRLSGKSEGDKIKIIKSLICDLEGKLNKAIFYSIAAISYALIIGAASLFCGMKYVSDVPKAATALTMIVVAVVLIIAGTIYSINDKKDTFILKALYFKLDELNEKK